MTSPEVGAETDVQAYSLLLNGHADKQPRNNIKAIRLSCICCFLQRTYWSESRAAYQFPQENGQCDDKKTAMHCMMAHTQGGKRSSATLMKQ
ncbi:hypothetical protein ACPEGW_11685 [Escherichia coli]|uniref:hypothetical protein n=1 Tax=Escherichia coli TaxID=562 RepID=UPI003C2D7533